MSYKAWFFVLLEVRTTRVALSERAVFPFSVRYPTMASGDNAGRDPKDSVLMNGTGGQSHSEAGPRRRSRELLFSCRYKRTQKLSLYLLAVRNRRRSKVGVALAEHRDEGS